MTLRVYICLVAGLAGLAFGFDRAAGADFDMGETAGSTRTWHETDGLLSDSVTAIIQTRDGFLWVGTTAGLVRFDGVKFTELKLAAFATNSPVRVSALCEDSDGHLWIGTQQNGLFQLAQGRLQHYSQTDGLLDDTVTSLAADSHGQVWIGSKSGLNLWTGQHFQSFTKQDGLPDELVSGVNVARSGTVWITARNGMCRIINGHITPYAFQTESQGRSPEYLGTYEDRQGNLWAFGDTYLINLTEGKRFNYFRSSESASVRIWSLCEGRDGRIWIGTSGRGLFCFEDNRFQPVILGESRWPYDVRAICEDREGNLWLGTSGGGLVQLRPQSVHTLRAGQGLSSSSTTALALDAGGKIYVGLQRGGLFVGESGRFDRVGGDGLDVQNFVSSLCVARDGVLWAGTLGGGLYGSRNGRGVHFTTANGLADDNALAVCADAAGGIWVSTSAGTVHRFTGQGLTRFDAARGLPGIPVTVMIPSATGGLWLGTQDGQILREEKNQFTRSATLTNSGSYPVLALHEGEAGQLWIGTSGGGLDCLLNGSLIHWNTSNGLPNDIVAGVVEDQTKNLWLATGVGIYRVNRDDLRRTLDNPRVPLACKLIAEAKTLPESTTVSGGPRALLSPDGDLWFATSEGLLKVNTHQTEIEPSLMPPYLVSAAFNGGPALSLLRGSLWSPAVTNQSPFKTPADARSLEVHFTALDFTAPGDIRFRHKLDGSDLDWVEDGGSRSVRYGRLPYGDYRFRVAARLRDGAWQESPESFAFIVPTPFYLRGWAIFLFGLSGVAVVAGIVRIVSHRRLRVALARLEQQQSLERERMRIARDMHDEMGSKLTKISFLSEHAQVDAAAGPLAEKIESIAQTSRDLLQTMDEIVWVVNPHNDTLENLAAYLSHYAVEYFQNTAVECEMRLPQEIPHYPLVSEARHNLFLTFEEALNNVLKHSAASKVKVEMTLAAREFAVRVTDNGKGFVVPVLSAVPAPTRGGRGGNGLTNMRQRLLDIGGECLISSQPGQGTNVTLCIHLNSKAAR
ncbi:MAG TPA: two-component regulator propeller domain-containing protein [Verrucomicrobiae bacterium]|nr:two-component regulator propeller domain-containing protein [Verrucomicrobiae bacterium]